MAEFQSLALVSAHQPIPAFLNYGISDLTELCGLAAYVRDIVDDVAIPVSPTDRDPLAGFDGHMKRRRPQLVGISAYTCGASAALRYAELAKRWNAHVVMGGFHASALPEEMLRSPWVDAVVRGEGEETLRELVLNGPSREVLGLSFRDGSQIVHNPDRPIIEDLDRLPLPLREVRPPRFGLDGLHYHTDSIYTSRGCRGKCTFCANHLVGKKWRRRSHQQVLEELASIVPSKRRKPKLVKLWDANFMASVEHTAELCDMLIEHGFHDRFRFVAETRVADIIRGKDLLPRMKEAGFLKLGTGVESPNPETLRLVKKGVKVESVEEAAQLVARHGMHLAKFFIIGHPNEDVEDILRYPDFATSRGVRKQSAYFFALTPYPGTEIYAQYRQQGLIKSDDWDLYTNYGAVLEPNGIPKLTLQALVGTLPMQYSLSKRFSRGEPFRRLASKLLGLLLVSAKAVQLHRSHPREELEDAVWQGLAYLRELPEREAPGRPARALALRFFHRDRQTLTVSFLGDGKVERVSITTGDAGIPAAKRRLTLNFSIRQLYRLAESIDPRRLGHDVLTLLLKPSAMRPRWALSLVGQTVKAALVLGRMALFDLRKSFSR